MYGLLAPSRSYWRHRPPRLPRVWPITIARSASHSATTAPYLSAYSWQTRRRAAPSEPVGTGPRLSRPLYPIPVPRPATGLRFPRPTDRRSSLAAHSKYEEELDGQSDSRGGSARAPRPFRYLRYRVRRGTGDGATGAAASRRRPVAGCRGDCQAARRRTPADRAPSWRHRLRFHPPRDRDPAAGRQSAAEPAP